MNFSDLNPKMQAQVAASLYPEKAVSMRSGGVSTSWVGVDTPKRLRQSQKQPNKLETAFAAYLEQTQPTLTGLRAGCVTLQLANGVRYTPDLVGWVGDDLTAWEVKGFMRDDAAVKLKVAASLWPEISFVLVWKDQGCWRQQEILP